MTRHSFWVVPALALAIAVPAVAKDNEKEKGRDRAGHEAQYGDAYYYDNESLRGVANTRFSGMDRNGDGVITRPEWRGNNQSFQQHDRNRDGVLSGREVWTSDRNMSVDDNRAAFGSLDHNHDGVLDGREWPYGASAFNRLDRNDDRRVEIWEYRNQ
jgi:EF hand